jgi:signal transduction histidine kinase
LLPWIGTTVTTRELLDELESSTRRLSDLVNAVKEYSYMDQAPLQEIDVREGLASTLTMLGHKLKKGDIVVTREYEDDLPRINAYGSELNQVWTNLIDNAIDALNGTGRIRVRTSREPDRVLVEITDDGPDTPEAIEPCIFEPFFTTRGVGGGTGLVLDVARRIVVGHHGGDTRVDSKPGETNFAVRLPVDVLGNGTVTP